MKSSGGNLLAGRSWSEKALPSKGRSWKRFSDREKRDGRLYTPESLKKRLRFPINDACLPLTTLLGESQGISWLS